MMGKQNNIILIKLCKLIYADGVQTTGLLHMLMQSARQVFWTAQQSLYMTLNSRNYTVLILSKWSQDKCLSNVDSRLISMSKYTKLFNAVN